RLFCDYSYTPIWKQEEEYGKANGIIWWVIEEFKSLSIAQNIDFLVVFSPIEWELVTGTEYKFKPVLDSCKANSIPFLDIRDEFKRLGVNVGTDEGRLINLYRHFVSNSEAGTNSSNPKNLYWPIDYHFNNFGYALFATALLNEVMRSYNHQIQNSHLLTTENPIPRNPNSASAH
ncbi:MAG: hypothetical protein H6603_09785, partial [Flavobacteriales bacterium]|nr:hypothetical protein [Flavobacteriales bacterium]